MDSVSHTQSFTCSFMHERIAEILSTPLSFSSKFLLWVSITLCDIWDKTVNIYEYEKATLVTFKIYLQMHK